MIKNSTERFDIVWKIRRKGNWNYRFFDKPSVSTKPIGIINLGEDEFVFKHDDIFEIIKCYHEADKESIAMILDENVDTGIITNPEISFIEKLKKLINELEKGECITLK